MEYKYNDPKHFGINIIQMLLWDKFVIATNNNKVNKTLSRYFVAKHLRVLDSNMSFADFPLFSSYFT